jgi:L-ascorbate oxidase
MLRTKVAAGLLVLLQACSQRNNVSAAVREFHFDIEPMLGDAYSPDCQNTKEQRRFLSLVKDSMNDDGSNPSMPGPLIEADEGDVIRVTVTNHHISLAHTIHYHGLHLVGAPWSDGPNAITQCALGPGQSQTAEFVAYPPGTHYWHGHLGMDVLDGVTGPIIIHPSEPEPFDYDEERILFLQDFYMDTGTQQLVGLENWPFTWVGNPDSLLINGKGLATACLDGGDNAGDATACLSTCNDTLAWLSNISVDPGKTYRFRIINRYVERASGFLLLLGLEEN